MKDIGHPHRIKVYFRTNRAQNLLPPHASPPLLLDAPLMPPPPLPLPPAPCALHLDVAHAKRWHSCRSPAFSITIFLKSSLYTTFLAIETRYTFVAMRSVCRCATVPPPWRSRILPKHEVTRSYLKQQRRWELCQWISSFIEAGRVFHKDQLHSRVHILETAGRIHVWLWTGALSRKPPIQWSFLCFTKFFNLGYFSPSFRSVRTATMIKSCLNSCLLGWN